MTTGSGARVHAEKAGLVDMALPAAESFRLFNAVGERRWVKDWAPSFVYPPEPAAGEGTVFQTRKIGIGTATWIQTRHDPDRGGTSFVYVIPHHCATMVDVDITANGKDRSRASVRYRMTSLSPGADGTVRKFAEDFEDMMVAWAESIRRHIVEGVPPGQESDL